MLRAGAASSCWGAFGVDPPEQRPSLRCVKTSSSLALSAALHEVQDFQSWPCITFHAAFKTGELSTIHVQKRWNAT